MIEAGACAIQIENQVWMLNNVVIKMEKLLYLMKILLLKLMLLDTLLRIRSR
jgi:hypothetical protein